MLFCVVLCPWVHKVCGYRVVCAYIGTCVSVRVGMGMGVCAPIAHVPYPVVCLFLWHLQVVMGASENLEFIVYCYMYTIYIFLSSL